MRKVSSRTDSGVPLQICFAGSTLPITTTFSGTTYSASPSPPLQQNGSNQGQLTNGLNGSNGQNSCLLFYAFNYVGGEYVDLLLKCL